MSSWKVYQGLVEREGLIGQFGSELVIIHATQAAVAANNIWQKPSNSRGRVVVRDKNEPALLPIPSPIRNTARMIENVYTVAPNISDNKRV